MIEFNKVNYSSEASARWAVFFEELKIPFTYDESVDVFHLDSMGITAYMVPDDKVPTLLRVAREAEKNLKPETGKFGEPVGMSAVLLTGNPWDADAAIPMGTAWSHTTPSHLTELNSGYSGFFMTISGYPACIVQHAESGLHFRGSMLTTADVGKVLTTEDRNAWRHAASVTKTFQFEESKPESPIDRINAAIYDQPCDNTELRPFGSDVKPAEPEPVPAAPESEQPKASLEVSEPVEPAKDVPASTSETDDDEDDVQELNFDQTEIDGMDLQTALKQATETQAKPAEPEPVTTETKDVSPAVSTSAEHSETAPDQKSADQPATSAEVPADATLKESPNSDTSKETNTEVTEDTEDAKSPEPEHSDSADAAKDMPSDIETNTAGKASYKDRLRSMMDNVLFEQSPDTEDSAPAAPPAPDTEPTPEPEPEPVPSTDSTSDDSLLPDLSEEKKKAILIWIECTTMEQDEINHGHNLGDILELCRKYTGINVSHDELLWCFLKAEYPYQQFHGNEYFGISPRSLIFRMKMKPDYVPDPDAWKERSSAVAQIKNAKK